MLVSKNAKICITPNANAKICVTPNVSRWNIGGIGSPTRGAGVGHIDFMLFVSISFTQFPVEYGLYAISTARVIFTLKKT